MGRHMLIFYFVYFYRKVEINKSFSFLIYGYASEYVLYSCVTLSYFTYGANVSYGEEKIE